MSQQVNSSVPSMQDVVQPLAMASAVEQGLPIAEPTSTQLNRIDAMLAAQRAQQAKLGLALKAAKTGSTDSTLADASQAWAAPALGEYAGWFAASSLAVLLLCAGFVVVWRGRFVKAAPPQPAVQNSITDSLLMVSEYDALQPWGPTPTEAAMSQPAPGSLGSPALVEDMLVEDVLVDDALVNDAQHIDLDFDVSVSSVAQVDVASPALDAESDFVSDKVRKVQQSLAYKRAVRKSQQRALQPEGLLEMIEPTPEQVLGSAFAPLPELTFDLAQPTAPRAPIDYLAQLTDDDAQWTVQLQLAQEMADLGQTEDAQALCQEAFVKGSENIRDIALQIMTRLPDFKQP